MKAQELMVWIVLAAMTPSCAADSGVPGDAVVDGDAIGDTDGEEAAVPCPESMDADQDTITNADELLYDADLDGDGTQNHHDEDSDGDGIPDSVEAGDADCSSPPVDSDEDSMPDFVDMDSDGNGVPDSVEGFEDSDGDGTPDFADLDDDADLIPDSDEIDTPSDPEDTDEDGTPDYRDEDSDGDGIDDILEKLADPDGDGVPAFRDDDSDGDGMPDADERGSGDLPRNTDGDGFPDFLDSDSDGDGLADGQELEVGADPLDTDTDDDGFDDLAEWAHPDADPTDPLSGIPPDDYYVILPAHDPAVQRDLDFGTDLQVADIFFLMDTTGSMYGEIDRIVETLGDYIIPEIRVRIPDAAFGVGQFADFASGSYGSGADLAFELIQTMTLDEAVAQAAVEAIPLSIGGDIPESHVEALYQTMTGEGLGTWIPAHACPDGVGAPCFRYGALPIIVMVTDAPMHNGPPAGSGSDYSGISPAPHSWEEAIEELNLLHAKVIGLDSERAGLTYAWFDLERTAVLTGTVDDTGSPLVFDIGIEGELLDTTVVDAVETLATRVAFDVDTYVEDSPDGYTDIAEVDARCFVKERRPQPGWIPPSGYTPEQAVDHIDLTKFHDVIPGTSISFMVTFHNEVDSDTACYEGDLMARVFLATIVVRGDGVTDLDEREVVIIVPALPPELM